MKTEFSLLLSRDDIIDAYNMLMDDFMKDSVRINGEIDIKAIIFADNASVTSDGDELIVKEMQ